MKLLSHISLSVWVCVCLYMVSRYLSLSLSLPPSSFMFSLYVSLSVCSLGLQKKKKKKQVAGPLTVYDMQRTRSKSAYNSIASRHQRRLMFERQRREQAAVRYILSLSLSLDILYASLSMCAHFEILTCILPPLISMCSTTCPSTMRSAKSTRGS